MMTGDGLNWNLQPGYSVRREPRMGKLTAMSVTDRDALSVPTQVCEDFVDIVTRPDGTEYEHFGVEAIGNHRQVTFEAMSSIRLCLVCGKRADGKPDWFTREPCTSSGGSR